MVRGDGGPGPDGALRTVIEATVRGAGMDVEDVTVRLTGARRVVRIVVDRDGGVGLDDAAALSRDIAAALDTDDLVPGQAAYTLEVTSRGVAAPLRLPRHFRRASGRLASLVGPDGTARRVRLVGVDGTDVVVLPSDDTREIDRVPMADIVSATVEIEFTPVPEDLADWIRRWRRESDGPSPALGTHRIEGNDAG